jgi:hypothetical protein
MVFIMQKLWDKLSVQLRVYRKLKEVYIFQVCFNAVKYIAVLTEK